jgi:threonine dehydrogenase-like Zn-dependent dehydrogenase
VLCAPRRFDVIDAPMPRIEDDAVLIRVAYCGVCTSELDMWEGKAGDNIFPRFPGHEVSGIVEKVGVVLTSGRLTLDGLVTHRYALQDIDKAFAVAHEKPMGFVKATVCVGE